MDGSGPWLKQDRRYWSLRISWPGAEPKGVCVKRGGSDVAEWLFTTGVQLATVGVVLLIVLEYLTGGNGSGPA